MYDNVRNSFSIRFRLLWNIQAYRSGDREETCATIGIKKSYSESCISIYQYINTAMGQAIKDSDGFVKFLVSRKARKILGCHIIGSQASILIHEVLVAMKAAGSGNGAKLLYPA
jgi:pyruvate/2-oxoglutarate dehydrogenase complex dihydrolipoamide dehydrogenase (E3) component